MRQEYKDAIYEAFYPEHDYPQELITDKMYDKMGRTSIGASAILRAYSELARKYIVNRLYGKDLR